MAEEKKSFFNFSFPDSTGESSEDTGKKMNGKSKEHCADTPTMSMPELLDESYEEVAKLICKSDEIMRSAENDAVAGDFIDSIATTDKKILKNILITLTMMVYMSNESATTTSSTKEPEYICKRPGSTKWVLLIEDEKTRKTLASDPDCEEKYMKQMNRVKRMGSKTARGFWSDKKKDFIPVEKNDEGKWVPIKDPADET